MISKRWFWAAVALQILLLLCLVGRHTFTLATGTPVLLQTAPVDPWDPLRGEYVRLNYAISTLTPGATPMTGWPYERDQTVWVVLHAGDPFWTPAAVAATRPTVAAREVALRAVVTDAYTGPNPQLQVRYGIEQFYVPEGQGRDLEGRRPQLTVEAKVDTFGQAGLSRVFLEGQEIRWR